MRSANMSIWRGSANCNLLLVSNVTLTIWHTFLLKHSFKAYNHVKKDAHDLHYIIKVNIH